MYDENVCITGPQIILDKRARLQRMVKMCADFDHRKEKTKNWVKTARKIWLYKDGIY